MGSNRVIRGGSWNNSPQNCRSAYRNRNTASNRNNNLGFRVARSFARRVDACRTKPDAFLPE
ncbi:MAG: formylglycine-generating enzyme family protein [Planctomycetota bacterium]